MVGHNNMIPNGHFHKKWQAHLKVRFNQPMQKLRRSSIRRKKLITKAPQPVKLLRPLVHCPSVRYNRKIRAGRGFTLQELKQAGLNKKFVRTIGIAVDSRRRNHCLETIFRNVQRLKEYRNKLIMHPAKIKEAVVMDPGMALNQVKPVQTKVSGRVVTEEEKKFEAFVTLRRARTAAKASRAKSRRSKTDILEGGRAVSAC